MADYNVKAGGTATTGASTSFDLDQCYPTIGAASDELIANGSNGDRIVVEDGVTINDGTDSAAFRINATDASKNFFVINRSETPGAGKLLHTSNAVNTLVNINPSNAGTPLHNITIDGFIWDNTDLLYDDLAERPAQFITDVGTVSLENCEFRNFNLRTSVNALNQARLFRTGNTTGMTFEMTDCVIDGLRLVPDSRTGTKRGPMLCAEDNVTMTLTNLTVKNCYWSGYGADTRPPLLADDSGSITISGGEWINNTLTTEPLLDPVGDTLVGVSSMIEISGTGDVTIDGVIVRDNYYLPGPAQNISCGFFSDQAGSSSSQNHVVSNCTFSNNIVDPLANNRLGGLVRAQSQGSFVTINDCIAEQNTGFFGALFDASSGGACEINRCISRYNKGGLRNDGGENINGIGLYIGGGAEDCTINATAVYGHNETYDGAALYVHNTNTPAVPGARTVNFNHCTFYDNGSNAIVINSSDENLTVNFVNCVIDTEIVVGGSEDTTMTLTFTNCATSKAATMAALVSDTVASLTETDTISVDDLYLDDHCRPYANSPLIRAGATAASVLTDPDGAFFNAANPTVGAYAVATAGGAKTHGYLLLNRGFNGAGPELIAGGTPVTIIASGTFDTCTITVESSNETDGDRETVTTFTAAGTFTYTPQPGEILRATLSSVGASTDVNCRLVA